MGSIRAPTQRVGRGLLTSERSEVRLSRQFGELEIVGSNPTVLTKCTKQHRAEVQLGARLVWDQEVFGSTPRCPT